MIDIGRYNDLEIIDSQPQGLYLADEEGERILLPKRQLPDQWQIGDRLSVFVYLDSEDRPIATRQRPRGQLHQVVCLDVIDVNAMGAFLDWGLSKDLLLPFSEQQQRATVGDRVVVYITEDDQGRLIASARLNRFIRDEVASAWMGTANNSESSSTQSEHYQDDDNDRPRFNHQYATGDQVRATIVSRTDLGYKAAVDHQFWGVIHHSQIRQAIRPGQTVTAYVRRLREDKRLDLALEPIGNQRTEQLTKRLLRQLQQGNGSIGLSDHSPAEQIELQLGVSKRLFKMAVGRLLAAGQIVLEDNGIRLATEAEQRDIKQKKKQANKRTSDSKKATSKQSPKRHHRKDQKTDGERNTGEKKNTDKDVNKPTKKDGNASAKKRIYNKPKSSGRTLSLKRSS